MQGRPQDYMKVGVIHFMAFPEVMKGEGPVVETLERLCADDYFQAVEVTQVKDPAVRARAIEVAREAGKTVAFGAQPILLGGKLDLNSLDADARQVAVDAARGALDEAIEWGACGFAVLSGPDPGEEKRDEARAMLIASLKEICEFSRRKKGPPVLLETFDRVPYGKNCLIGPTDEAAEIADKVYPFYLDFGLMVDLSHLPLLSESPETCIAAAGQHLKHVHIGNCVMRDESHPAYGDNHPVFGIPEGENGMDELAAFLKALLDAGYLGKGGENIVSFEVKPFGDQTSDEAIANAKETLDAAWAALS